MNLEKFWECKTEEQIAKVKMNKRKENIIDLWTPL
jgi:hypothetical protein